MSQIRQVGEEAGVELGWTGGERFQTEKNKTQKGHVQGHSRTSVGLYKRVQHERDGFGDDVGDRSRR